MENEDEKISLLGAMAIGIGGMVGGGIFAVLGLAAVMAKGATPLAFVVAGFVSLLTAYSYSKLSVAFPSDGGTIIFIDKAFGISWATGAINNILWFGYIVTLALYTVAFSNYAGTFLPESLQGAIASHALITAGIAVPTLLNLLSAAIVSKTESIVVAIKLAILLLVIVAGFGGIDWSNLAPSTWEGPLQIVGAGMIIFVAYEGFELIANTSATVEDPKKTLPRAYYGSVVSVIAIYVLIAIVVVGALPADQIAAAQDFALAEAAKPSLGQFGFTVVGIAAILATFSAINSTVYGAARLSYAIASEGELPARLEKKVWNQPVGLLITSGAAIVLANSIELSSISTMASACFLIIFALVNLANVVTSDEVGSSKPLAGLGVLACTGALVALLVHTFQETPNELWPLAGLIVFAFAGERIFWFVRSNKTPESEGEFRL